MTEFKGLDLFANAGGCTAGYVRGFQARGHTVRMTGVDWHKSPRYRLSGGYDFRHCEVMRVLTNPDWHDWLDSYDFFHLSPPCQGFSKTRVFNKDSMDRHTDLVTPCLEILKRDWSHKLWVMENVPEAPMYSRVDQILRLCASSFPGHCGFDERRLMHRHRRFRLHGFQVPKIQCAHNGYKPIGVYGALNSGPPGGGEEPANMAKACKLMQIDWMKWRELKEAVPPAYSQYVTTAPGGLVDMLEGVPAYETV